MWGEPLPLVYAERRTRDESISPVNTTFSSASLSGTDIALPNSKEKDHCAYVRIVSDQQEQAVPSLQAIVQLVQAEASANRLAAAMVITRCSELLFLQAVRAYLSSAGDGHVGWYSALKDPQIGQALALIQYQQGDGGLRIADGGQKPQLQSAAMAAR